MKHNIELREHQKPMLDYWVNSQHPALVVQMRLGKTIVAVQGTKEWGTKYNLVIAPIQAMDGWEKELKAEGEKFIRAYACPSVKRKEAFKRFFEYDDRVWILMNFEGFRAIPGVVMMPFDTVIVDEGAKIKNPQSKISKTLTEAFRNVKHRALLNGLLTPESYLDIFQQFKYLHGSFLGYKNYYTFRQDLFYLPDSDYYFEWKPNPGTIELLKDILKKKAYVLTRKQANFTDKKVYSRRIVKMNPEQARIYRQIEKEFRYEATGLDFETIWATEKGIWLSRVASGMLPKDNQVISTAKADEIYSLFKGELKEEQGVVYYKFVAQVKADYEYLTNKGIKCSITHGSILPKKQQIEVDKFRSGKTQLLLTTEKLGEGHKGKDYSNASVLVYHSNELSCDIRGQSEERVFSAVEQDAKLIIDLITEDTCDLAHVETVQKKVFDAKFLMTQFLDHKTSAKDIFEL
jgi:superfamily II DNA or RNA helicase